MDPSRVVVATVFEPRDHFPAEVELLYRSMSLRGGRLASARRIAYCVGTPDANLKATLEELDVEIRESPPFDDRCAHANKLAMFERHPDADLLLALDTDVAFTGDPTGWLLEDVIGAKPVDCNIFEESQWKRLFGHFGLDVPTSRDLPHAEGPPVPPYFNSGVISVPMEHVGSIASRWGANVLRLLDEYAELGQDIAKYRFFTDQFAFALTLAELRLPVTNLPLEMNFPTHIELRSVHRPDVVHPVLVHHHHRLDGGLLRPCGYQTADAAMSRLNAAVVASRSVAGPTKIDEPPVQAPEHPPHPPVVRRSGRLDFAGWGLRRRVLAQNGVEPGDPQAGNDISWETLAELATVTAHPETLIDLVNLSRRHFGWYTRHQARSLEYPWVVEASGNVAGQIILDIGAGISPVPLALAERGAHVLTIDNSRLLRHRHEIVASNEWGFLDYSGLDLRTRSVWRDASDLELTAQSCDVVLSISVIEHLPATTRRELINRSARWLRSGGRLVLTVDLVPGTDDLWNLSEGEQVEARGLHGSFDVLLREVEDAGVDVTFAETVEWADTKLKRPTDLGFIVGVRTSTSGDLVSEDLPWRRREALDVLGPTG